MYIYIHIHTYFGLTREPAVAQTPLLAPEPAEQHLHVGYL